MNTNKRLFSRAELAAALGITLKTLHNWRDRGKFPQPVNGGPKGKVKYYDLEQVRDAIATHKLKVKIDI